MSVFRMLIVAACVLVVLISVAPEEHGTEPVRELLQNFEGDALRSRFGVARTFNHSETRQVYKLILSEAQKAIDGSGEDAGRRAFTCSKVRFEARRYARSRDGSLGGHITDIALQLRDSYVHGIKHLPLAVRKDVADSLALEKPSLVHTAIVLRQAYNCLAPTLSGGECPSYAFLRVIREKSDADILGSCTMSNKGFDNI